MKYPIIMTPHIYLRSLALVLILSLGLTACDDFLDVNENPNQITEASLKSLLPPILEGTSTAHYDMAVPVCNVTQQIGSYFFYPNSEDLRGSASDAWEQIYRRNVGNLVQLISQAEEQESPHYAGVGRVLMAVNLGMLTSAFEDIPYTEAGLGPENLTPVYDSQESIYDNIQSLLDQAIIDLGASTSVFSPSGDDDLAYNGNLDAWTRLANGLKARYQLHTWNRSVDESIFSHLDLGLVDTMGDFQVAYNDRIFNPWHVLALAVNTGNLTFTFGSYFIDELNRTNDPRLPVFVDTSGLGDASVRGITIYDENAPEPNVDFEETDYYMTQSAPIQMFTYAEQKFIEAEAALSLGRRDRAYQAYLEGIAAHMTKMGLSSDEIATYQANPLVGVGAGALTEREVMREKYVALYLNPEQWNDMRRYNYSAAVYPDFVIPDVAMFDGPAQRMLYPLSEVNRNGTNVAAAEKPFATRMWRDQ